MVGFVGGLASKDCLTVLHRGEVILPLKDAANLKKVVTEIAKSPPLWTFL